MLFWLMIFLLSSAGVIGGGISLERVTEEWAERSGVTKEWAGFLILSIVTSTPEFATAISGAVNNYPDLVIGDILGGNFFNIVVFSLFSFLWYDLFRCINKRVTYELIAWNIAFNIILIFALYFRMNLFPVFLLYPFVAMRVFERSGDKTSFEGDNGGRRLKYYFIFAITLVIGSGYFLIVSGAQLSELMNLSNTFIGTLFVAIVTSAPELSTSFTALLRKAHGLCVGNVLGSNVLNFFILPIAAFFFKDPMVKVSSQAHMLTAMGLLISSLLLFVSLSFAFKKIRLFPVLIYLMVISLLGKGV